jgi:ABC-type transport system substrate-binding protein
MKRNLRGFAAAGALFLTMFAAEAAFAQKQGGILKMYSIDSPPSMSVHEEAAATAQRPIMGVFNNLVMFDQHVKQNSLQSIIPDLAISWSWNENGTELTFSLRADAASSWQASVLAPFYSRHPRCSMPNRISVCVSALPQVPEPRLPASVVLLVTLPDLTVL